MVAFQDPRPIAEELWREVYDLRLLGYTVAAIARETGLDDRTVDKAVKTGWAGSAYASAGIDALITVIADAGASPDTYTTRELDAMAQELSQLARDVLAGKDDTARSLAMALAARDSAANTLLSATIVSRSMMTLVDGLPELIQRQLAASIDASPADQIKQRVQLIGVFTQVIRSATAVSADVAKLLERFNMLPSPAKAGEAGLASLDDRAEAAFEIAVSDYEDAQRAWARLQRKRQRKLAHVEVHNGDPDGCTTHDTAQSWTVQGWAGDRWAIVTVERSREAAVACMMTFAGTKRHLNTYRVKAGTPAVRGGVVAACYVEYLDDETNLDALVRVLPGTVG